MAFENEEIFSQQISEIHVSVSTALIADNYATRMLKALVKGVEQATLGCDSTGLQLAFDAVIECGAIRPARALCWFWSYRANRRGPVPTGEVLRWKWRLIWLTLELANNDEKYLEGFRKQELNFWTQVAESSSLSSPEDVRRELIKIDEQPSTIVKRTLDKISAIAAVECGVAGWTLEISIQLELIKDLSILNSGRADMLALYADLILTPFCAERIPQLHDDLGRLRSALSKRDASNQYVKEWIADVEILEALVNVVSQKAMNAGTSRARIKAFPVCSELSARLGGKLL